MTRFSTCLSALLLALGLILSAQPSQADQGTGLPQKRRPHKPLTPNTDCANYPFHLDGVEARFGDHMGEEGLILIQLTEDPTKWSWAALQRFASKECQPLLEGFNVFAVYPETPYTRYAKEDLDHLREFMPVGIIDDDTRRWLPPVGDQVVVSAFDFPGTYQGSFDGIDTPKAVDGFINATTSGMKKKKAAPKKSKQGSAGQ